MKLSRFAAGLASLVVAFSLRAAPPPELPVETFFKKPNISQLRFSPNGKRIACLVPYEHRMNVAVIDLEKKTKNLLSKFKDNDVSSVMWGNDDRLIFFKDEDGQEAPSVYGVNVDGSAPSLLVGGSAKVGTTQETNNRITRLLAPSRRDPKSFLVLGRMSGAQGSDVCTMNLQTGRMSLVTANPGYISSWVLDGEQRVRMGVAREGQKITIMLFNEKGGWEVLETRTADQPGWSPIGFGADGLTLYVLSSVGRKTQAIFTYDLQTRTLGPLVFGDDVYDVEDAIEDDVRGAVVGFSYHAERQRFHWLDAEAAAFQQRIDASLPDTVNTVRKASLDGSRHLIAAASPQDPGVYYLFDKATKKLEEIAVAKPWIEPDQMGVMKPISFKSRDGLTIHGYLTLPPSREPKKLPLILHPHGGPFGIRDHWTFSPEIQFYANRGYAVLQVNYRGSGGYGGKFEKAGWKKWGLEMQNDLSDAVKWAVDGGIADSQRVVISGASYGGYATMAGLAFTPELYCAGINYVGVVDIDELIPRGEGVTPERAHSYSTRIGDLGNAADRKRIYDTSPVHFADRIRAPVLMAYGKNDPRVRISQGVDMEAAMKKAGKTYEMIIEKDEGHGFRKEELSIAFYTRVDAFLKKYVQKANVKIGPTEVLEMPAKKKS